MTSTLTVPEVRKQLLALLRDARGTADSIACTLARKGVRRARCGESFKCALAQYLTNGLPTGFSVSVSTAITVYTGKRSALKPVVQMPTPPRFKQFMSRFDSNLYPFLMW